MKQLFKPTFLVLALLAALGNASFAQVAAPGQLVLRPVSDALTLVGSNSDDSQFGPYFGGSVAYGIGSGITLFAESGYGWTKYDYVFSDEDKPGLQSQDWSGLGIGGGISYLFSF